MAEEKRRDWRQVAQEAANETNSEKLLALARELIVALERGENRLSEDLPPSSGSRQFGRRLLFVDDEASIRLTLPPILREYSFDVHVASSVPEAVAAIGEHKYDVLVCDLNISKEGDGFRVVQAVQETNPRCVVILLTGYPGLESATQAIHVEVDDYFVKPAAVELLVSTIERKLRARRAVGAPEG
jgi:DNA-binding NtrC family response regulator